MEKFENEKREERLMKDLYKRHLESREGKMGRISVEELQELKEVSVTTERFLDYLCQH